MSTVAEVMAELESLGTEQARKIYARHGAKPPMFGVSYAHMGKIAKRLKTNQPLAEALWKSGNHDARVLATMIADPALCSKAHMNAWVKSVASYPSAGSVAGVAGCSPDAAELVAEWTASADEYVAATGWDTFSHRCGAGGGWECAGQRAGQATTPSPKECLAALARIEATIHGAKNRVRYSMNGAVIAIGCLGGELRDAALAAARRIGFVDVDHGETGCKTPVAEESILKALAYKEAKAAGKSTRDAVAESKTKATAKAKATAKPKSGETAKAKAPGKAEGKKAAAATKPAAKKAASAKAVDAKSAQKSTEKKPAAKKSAASSGTGAKK